MKKKTKIWTVCIIGGLLLALSPMMLWSVAINRFIASHRKYMLEEVNHESVAQACLAILTDSRYSHLKNHFANGDDPILPPEIRKLNANCVDVNSNSVRIAMTGGHWHTSYSFRPVSNTSGEYDLVYEEELATDIPLTRITSDINTGEQKNSGD